LKYEGQTLAQGRDAAKAILTERAELVEKVKTQVMEKVNAGISQNADLRTKLVKYAANILSRRPYFSTSAEDKLFLYVEKNHLSQDDHVVNQIIADLAKSGYLDDDYLVAAFVRRQVQNITAPNNSSKAQTSRSQGRPNQHRLENGAK
jgi:SOS response regulatory protein OraA/RecX